MYLTTAAQIKEIDRVTIEEWGIPSTKLMENAAQAVVREILALPAMGSGRKNSAVGWFVGNGGDSFQEERSAIVFSGPGNNGGDGGAVGRVGAGASIQPELEQVPPEVLGATMAGMASPWPGSY